jgi:hypothetical protein
MSGTNRNPTLTGCPFVTKLQSCSSLDPIACGSKNGYRTREDLVRAHHRTEHDDRLVTGDDDLAEAIVGYPSLVRYGWTCPGEGLLADALNESDRNIRSCLARLRAAKLLIVIPPSEGWRSNRHVPMLEGGPQLEVALTSEELRDANADPRPDGDCTGTLKPHQNTAEAEATPPTSDIVAPLIAVAARAERGVAP